MEATSASRKIAESRFRGVKAVMFSAVMLGVVQEIPEAVAAVVPGLNVQAGAVFRAVPDNIVENVVVLDPAPHVANQPTLSDFAPVMGRDGRPSDGKGLTCAETIWVGITSGIRVREIEIVGNTSRCETEIVLRERAKRRSPAYVLPDGLDFGGAAYVWPALNSRQMHIGSGLPIGGVAIDRVGLRRSGGALGSSLSGGARYIQRIFGFAVGAEQKNKLENPDNGQDSGEYRHDNRADRDPPISPGSSFLHFLGIIAFEAAFGGLCGYLGLYRGRSRLAWGGDGVIGGLIALCSLRLSFPAGALRSVGL